MSRELELGARERVKMLRTAKEILLLQLYTAYKQCTVCGRGLGLGRWRARFAAPALSETQK